MRLNNKILLGVAGLAAVWTAGWFVGRALWVAPEADRAVERLREGSLFLTYDERRIGGFPFGYEIALIGLSVSDASGLWRWAAPEARIGGGLGAGGALEIRPAPESRLIVEPAAWEGGADAAPLLLSLKAEAPLIRLAPGPDRPHARLTAASLSAERVEGGGPVKGLRIAVAGLDADAAYDAGEGALVLSADRAEGEWRLSPDGVSEDAGALTFEALSVDFSGAALDAGGPEEFHARNGSATLALASARSTSSAGSTGGPSAAPMRAVGEAGPSATRIEVGQGRARIASEGEAVRWRLEGEGAPLIGFETSVAKATAGFDLPLRRAAAPQDWSARFAVEGATIAEPIWALFDPVGALGRAPMAMKVEIGGAARLFADLGAPSAGQSPLDLETLEIRAARLDALGATAEAKGELAIAGDASSPEGTIHLDLVGAHALLDRAVAGGLVPPAAEPEFRKVLETYLAPKGGEDALTSELVFAPGGAVTMNGQRVR